MVLIIRKNQKMYFFFIFSSTHDKSFLIKVEFWLTSITIKNRKYRQNAGSAT